MQNDNQGVKFDGDKLPIHLLPFDAIEEVTKVLQFGANKYDERNWERGMDWNRPFSALMRHMWAWWKGEDKDPETGLSHLAHAACCVLFLLTFETRGVGEDNRPNTKRYDHNSNAIADKLFPPIKDDGFVDIRKTDAVDEWDWNYHYDSEDG